MQYKKIRKNEFFTKSFAKKWVKSQKIIRKRNPINYYHLINRKFVLFKKIFYKDLKIDTQIHQHVRQLRHLDRLAVRDQLLKKKNQLVKQLKKH